MVNVFDEYKNCENKEMCKLPVNCSVKNICVTNDNNILMIDKDSKVLTLFGLE